MELSEAKEKAFDLRSKVRELIIRFEKETGLLVEHIIIQREEVFGGPKTVLYALDINIILPLITE